MPEMTVDSLQWELLQIELTRLKARVAELERDVMSQKHTIKLLEDLNAQLQAQNGIDRVIKLEVR